ncbi:MAG: bifunctional DNase/RNase, partial [Candidatus Omnitrophota bacterium]
MLEVELSKIIIDEKRQDQIIVLKEKESDRQFPIVIGFLEASSIKMKLADFQPPRPLTHDLLTDVINALGAELEHVIIDQMDKSTFHAKLVLRSVDDDKVVVDARPSDGIALAVRTGAGIFVDEDVIKKAVLV